MDQGSIAMICMSLAFLLNNVAIRWFEHKDQKRAEVAQTTSPLEDAEPSEAEKELSYERKFKSSSA